MDAQWTLITIALVLFFALVIGTVVWIILRRRDRPEARIQQLRDNLAHFEWLRHSLIQKLGSPEYDDVTTSLEGVRRHIEEIHALLDQAKEGTKRVHDILPPS